MHCRFLLIFGLGMALALGSVAEEDMGPTRQINPLKEVAISELSDPGNTVLGQAALAVRPGDWRHAETDHFILHFFHNYVAAQAAAELEFYYQAIAQELHRDNSSWERKSNVYIFESDADWHIFQGKAQLDPWTGGIHSDGNLFVIRNPQMKFEGRSLGHETAHLVLYRFFGAGIPLWLNEGYAENSSIRLYSGLERLRGFNMLPQSAVMNATNYIPLRTLTSAVSYPEDVTKVEAFYQESEKLVGFLRAQSESGFIDFMDALSHGNKMETALEKGYGLRFQTVDALEQEFSAYAQRKYVPLSGLGN